MVFSCPARLATAGSCRVAESCRKGGKPHDKDNKKTRCGEIFSNLFDVSMRENCGKKPGGVTDCVGSGRVRGGGAIVPRCRYEKSVEDFLNAG